MPGIGVGISPIFRSGGSFSPSSVPDLVAWYRADQGITLVGGRVQSWEDRSATGATVEALIPSARPNFVASVPSLNGRPALEFVSTGAADPLNMALVSHGTLLTNSHTTTFVVCQLSSDVGMSAPVLTSDSTSPTPRVRCLFDAGLPGLRYEIATGPSLPDGPVDLDPHLVVGELGATGIIRIDGIETANGPLFALQYDGMTVGAGPPAGLPTDPPTYSWNGYISEICIYNRGLDLTSETAPLEAHFMAKYGI